MLRVPRDMLMPIILLFCIVGAFAINNSRVRRGVMLVFGVVAFVHGGERLPGGAGDPRRGARHHARGELHHLDDQSDGSPAVFFTRPIAGGLAIATLVILLWPVGAWAVRRLARDGGSRWLPGRRA